eukprot:TRINITY_DN17829_c2_g1_i3.p1 TRINITY_DN17829_c2_g1~~TRINITY_DN17829_c2_g1_i3.p1  ORF type:complete len:361 (+),score=44.53 TRINITY_DN17829_c2_g1_i3:156-1238(+)
MLTLMMILVTMPTQQVTSAASFAMQLMVRTKVGSMCLYIKTRLVLLYVTALRSLRIEHVTLAGQLGNFAREKKNFCRQISMNCPVCQRQIDIRQSCSSLCQACLKELMPAKAPLIGLSSRSGSDTFSRSCYCYCCCCKISLGSCCFICMILLGSLLLHAFKALMFDFVVGEGIDLLVDAMPQRGDDLPVGSRFLQELICQQDFKILNKPLEDLFSSGHIGDEEGSSLLLLGPFIRTFVPGGILLEILDLMAGSKKSQNSAQGQNQRKHVKGKASISKSLQRLFVKVCGRPSDDRLKPQAEYLPNLPIFSDVDSDSDSRSGHFPNVNGDPERILDDIDDDLEDEDTPSFDDMHDRLYRDEL